MSKQREALQMALEWIEAQQEPRMIGAQKALRAIHEALAEPEPEPVARVKTVGGYPDASEHTVEWLVKFKDVMNGQLLYAAPPARKPLTDGELYAAFLMGLNSKKPVRKPLTDEEIDNLELPPNGCTMRELVRVVERAHGIGD